MKRKVASNDDRQIIAKTVQKYVKDSMATICLKTDGVIIVHLGNGN